jgi:hypothetical protein
MHILAAILAVILGAAFWIYRLNAARDAAETLAGAANDVRLAARRFGFRRKTNLHPADCVDDPRLAAMGIARMAADCRCNAGGLHFMASGHCDG